MSDIISVTGLTKRFKDFTAVDDLSFTITKGEVHGFLGQNGAGKSTTMRMLLGLIKPTSGRILINGEEFGQHRIDLLQHVGAIIERPDLYKYLSGWDNLKIFARLSGGNIPDKRLHELLELVDLKGREKDVVKAYSQGMKQRLGIAIALVHDPELLILDEPTNGLDPQGITEVRNLILQLSHEHKKTVLVSSHLLYEMEQVADRMLIIHKGKKIAEGSTKELLDADTVTYVVRLANDVHIGTHIQDTAWARHVALLEPGLIEITLDRTQVAEFNRYLVTQGADVLEIVKRNLLEDYFLKLTDAATGKN